MTALPPGGIRAPMRIAGARAAEVPAQPHGHEGTRLD
ncbi:hypothetical protein LMG9673_01593 [Ralstonia pseudosolanacearum]|nr:hypothetical protein LMG9673_01593 [Ralstonia pseudosolanacearum]